MKNLDYAVDVLTAAFSLARNENMSGFLQVAHVPEPGALVFAVLGGLLLVMGMRNRVLR